MTGLIAALKDDTLKIAGVPCELATFSASEVERMTGCPQQLQRLWRQRGFIPPTSSYHSRYDTWEVAQIAIRYQLTQVGQPVSETFTEETCKAAHVAMILALLCADGACEVIGKPFKVQRFLDKLNDPQLFNKPNTWEWHRYFMSLDGKSFRLWSTPRPPAGVLSFAVIDLARLGARMAEQAGKPLFTVRLDDDAGERRLTYARHVL